MPMYMPFMEANANVRAFYGGSADMLLAVQSVRVAGVERGGCSDRL